MYHVLIADDEPEVREGLKLKVDWEALGFSIAGEAGNGEEAGQLLQSGRFDVIVTDMNMPVMDGVQLLDLIGSCWPSLQIIIITGYEDFQYARAGMRSHAVDYLLKPVTRDELKNTLNKIRSVLDERRKQRQESEQMQWRLSQYYKEMKERFLLDLVKGKWPSTSSLADRFRLFDLESWQHQSVRMITTGLHPESRADSRAETITFHLPFQFICFETSHMFPDAVLPFHDPASSGLIHFVVCDDVQQDFIRSLTQQTAAGLRKDILIGISEPLSGMDQWKEGFLRSLLAWGMQGKSNLSQYLFAPDMEPLLVSEENKRVMHRSLNQGDTVTFRKMIRKMLKQANERSEAHLLHCMFQVSLWMESAAMLSAAPNLVPSQFSPEWMLWAENPEQAERLLMTWAEHYVQQLQLYESSADGSVVESAKRYIEENYMQELSLTALAEQYSYNPTYFSEMFKEQAGKSFIQYVTAVRMGHAIRLLKETSLTVWDIAELAGFSSSGYFSSRFKKTFNRTPSEFRLMQSQSEKIEMNEPKK